MKYQFIIASLISLLATASCSHGADEDRPAAWGDSTAVIDAADFNAADSMKPAPHNASLQLELESYVSRKDGMIGVCVVTDSLIYGVNLDERFPMMSTVKFATALAVADKFGAMADTIMVTRAQLRPGTWSPLRRMHRQGDLPIAVDRLLKFALTLSDNNAFDILTEYAGGPHAVQRRLGKLGIRDIMFRYYENQMNANWELYPDNWCTPRAMAALVYDFYKREDTPASKRIKELMAACKTGQNRLIAGIPDEGAVLHHKTGTGGNNPRTGLLRAINDVGYVELPGNRGGGGYAIAVFVAEANFNSHVAADCIADLSEITYNALR